MGAAGGWDCCRQDPACPPVPCGAFASAKVAFRARSHFPVNLRARLGERAWGLTQTKRRTGSSLGRRLRREASMAGCFSLRRRPGVLRGSMGSCILFAERRQAPCCPPLRMLPRSLGVRARGDKPFTPKHKDPEVPHPSLPAPGETRSQPLPGEEGRTQHPTLFLLGGHTPQNPPRAGAFRPSVRTYSLWLLH